MSLARWLLASALVLGCSSAPNDAGDGGTACGNGRLDPGEACDVAIAPGMPGACPAACTSDNSCLAMALVSAGTCAATCAQMAVADCCGNGLVEAGEACDDGNQKSFDGCSSSCQFERALILEQATLAAPNQGCDLDGNGTVDNAFSAAMNDTSRSFFSQALTTDLHGCQDTTYASLWVLVGADPTMTMGPFQLTIVFGEDIEMPALPADFFSGHEPFYVLPDTLDANGAPVHVVTGSATAGNLATAPPSLLSVALPSCLVPERKLFADYQRATLAAALQADASGPTRLSGMLCGAQTAASLYRTPNTTGFRGATLLDIAVLGLNRFGYLVTPTQPDIDVDVDGLETFQDTNGDGIIDLCTDGNGTQIAGTTCPLDPRIADGYSEAIEMTAVGAVLAGRAP